MSNYQEPQEAYRQDGAYQQDGAYPQEAYRQDGTYPQSVPQSSGGGTAYGAQSAYPSQVQPHATSQFPGPAGGQWYAEQSQRHGPSSGARRMNLRSSLKSTEFWVFAVVSIALLIAAAVSDGNNGGGFGPEAAWRYVTVLAAAYILSRGLTKFGGREEEDNDGH